jgi:hypothetical protein
MAGREGLVPDLVGVGLLRGLATRRLVAGLVVPGLPGTIPLGRLCFALLSHDVSLPHSRSDSPPLTHDWRLLTWAAAAQQGV